MPSAFIPAKLGYSAMPLVKQQIHQRFVHPGPLVLRTVPLKYPTPTPDRDRTVSRRSEPSSRTALMGEQPNPWNCLLYTSMLYFSGTILVTKEASPLRGNMNKYMDTLLKSSLFSSITADDVDRCV